jgi:hypothetical protein
MEPIPAMNGILKGVPWTAIFKGELWANNERNPVENQEIQVHLKLEGAREVEKTNVFVAVEMRELAGSTT